MQVRQRGFTLLEVLLALTVFVLTFGAILEDLGTASRNVRVAGDLGYVALIAQNRLDEVGVSEAIEPGVKTGTLDEKYRYELNITPYEPADSNVPPNGAAQLFRVELAVSWGNGAQTRTERFYTLRAKVREGQVF